MQAFHFLPSTLALRRALVLSAVLRMNHASSELPEPLTHFPAFREEQAFPALLCCAQGRRLACVG